jgi:hypothetical protein
MPDTSVEPIGRGLIKVRNVAPPFGGTRPATARQPRDNRAAAVRRRCGEVGDQPPV